MGSTEKDFAGTERFEIKQRLGSGGFGVVYEAFDRERNAPVALKTLHNSDSEAIYRFKQEFRALADITHRNLAALYELICEGDQWFFTMELVQGVNFLKYIRGDATVKPDGGRRGTAPRKVETATLTMSDPTHNFPINMTSVAVSPAITKKTPTKALTTKLAKELVPPCIIDLEQLRDLIRQLAMGVMALHSAGKLHRDLKPSNVLVTSEGRVVILDFGLAIELSRKSNNEQASRVVGTPQFMSPEQACGMPGTEASDWYSFGVMLFQALTGQLPFTGSSAEIMLKKQRREPLAPSDLVSGVPRDLDEICIDLLRRLPEDRPKGKEILKRIFTGHTSDLRKSLTQLTQLSPIESLPFVGREELLNNLDEAFLTMKEGKGVTVLVHGGSGLGKSALARHYIDAIQSLEAKALVLSGRCYERESVPYKALDSIVDALSRYLKGLTPNELEAILPHDVLALVRLFPVLRQLEVVAAARRRILNSPDTRELRRRSFTALRELLVRLADREMLVMFIDDLHWGDADSAALLAELLRHPEPPAIFLIATYRSEETETSPMLKELLAFFADHNYKLAVRKLEVGELSQDEAEELIYALLEDKEPIPAEKVKKIARESKGNPYFIDELVRFELTEKEKKNSKNISAELKAVETIVSLDNIVEARFASISPSAKEFLELVVVNGRPIEVEVIRRAIQLGAEEPMVMATLRSARLIRVRRTPQGDTVEPYHNRIRQVVLSKLTPEELKNYHLKLALALEATQCQDAEVLMAHFRDAGDLENTIKYSELAAEQSIEALAFDRAIQLYRFIIESLSNYEDKKQPTWVKLGDALANAGHGLEAAQAYLAAAEKADSTQKLTLQRLASEQFLVNGYVDQGVTILQDLLKTLDIGFAKTPQRAFLSAFLRRTYLKVRGLSFQEREANELSDEDLAKVDTLWSVTIGLTFVDPVRAADFQVRHLLYALNLGEPYRVARAIALDVIHSASAGGHTKEETEKLVQTALALAERIHHPHALGVATLTAGAAAYFIGNWSKAKELLERSETILRENYTRIFWELDVIQIYLLRSLYFMGEIKELIHRLPPLLRDAKERGDLSAISLLHTRYYIINLAQDNVLDAKKGLNLAIKQSSQENDFQLQHYWELFGEIEVALYSGDYQQAWQKLNESWQTLNKSLLFRIQVFLIETYHLHARVAIAMAQTVDNNEEFLRQAQQDIKRIEQEKMSWGNALAGLIRASLAVMRRDNKKAIELLAEAEVIFDSLEMSLYSAVARYNRGLLMNTPQGQELSKNASTWMLSQEIKNPARMAALLALSPPA